MEVELPSMPVSIRQNYQGKLSSSKAGLDKVKKTLVSQIRTRGPGHRRLTKRRGMYGTKDNVQTYFPDLGTHQTTLIRTIHLVSHPGRDCYKGPRRYKMDLGDWTMRSVSP